MSQKIDFTGPPVCVVGNLNRDVKVLNVPGSPAVLRDGETTVSGIVETIGGGGANSACAAAALGANIRFAGVVGADSLADRLHHAMEKHGVRTYLTRKPQVETGTTVALSFGTGQRHFLSCLPNNRSLAFDDLDLSSLDGCAHLLRSDVWFSESMLENGNRRLLAEARRRGLTTSLDINFDPCWSTGSAKEITRRKQQLRQVLSFVDLAHGNVRELCEFTDTAELKEALQCLDAWGVKAVVVHMGAKGAGYFTNGQLTVEPPELANNPVQSTGTGDVLSMCMILLQQRDDLSIRQKLRLANGVVREFMEGRRPLIASLPDLTRISTGACSQA
jgi:sugar/nucleoside kinase (ribokinase family)